MSGRSVNLTTLFLGRIRPPKLTYESGALPITLRGPANMILFFQNGYVCVLKDIVNVKLLLDLTIFIR